MHKIMREFFPTEEHEHTFQRLCNDQIDNMRAHDAQMIKVAEDPENYHPYPPPVGHPDVMASIVKEGNDYVIEYEIVEPTKPPEPTLEEKKLALVNQLNQAAMVASDALLPPPLKRRLADMEIQEILSVKEEERTAEQSEQLSDRRKRDKRLNEIYQLLAKSESEIHDLTEKTIGKWKMPTFEEAK